MREFMVHFSDGSIFPAANCQSVMDAMVKAVESTSHKFADAVKIELASVKNPFQKIFDDEKAVTSVMSAEELEEHLELLESVAFEAKARLQACKEEVRSRDDE